MATAAEPLCGGRNTDRSQYSAILFHPIDPSLEPCLKAERQSDRGMCTSIDRTPPCAGGGGRGAFGARLHLHVPPDVMEVGGVSGGEDVSLGERGHLGGRDLVDRAERDGPVDQHLAVSQPLRAPGGQHYQPELQQDLRHMNDNADQRDVCLFAERTVGVATIPNGAK